MLIAEKNYHNIALLVMGILAVIVLLTFQDYGISWDEEIQSQYGQAIYDYYASGFTDHRYNQLFNLYIYGGMFDALAAIINVYTPVEVYETRHLLNAFIGLLGLWGTWRLGTLLGGRFVGLAAMIILALTPMYYGHMFNNPKDIPFATGVVWTIYYMAKCLRSFPDVRTKLIIKLGLVFGLTLGVRVGGVMLLGFWGIAMLMQSASLLKHKSMWEIFWKLKRVYIPVTIISYVVMLVCWPWAQEAPLANPIKALIQFSNFPQNVEVLLNGTTYMSTELPWYYLPIYFFVQIPIMQLTLVFTGIATLPHIFSGLNGTGKKNILVFMLLTIFVPTLYAVLDRPALYDAVRHFIFILPLLCILGALALDKLVNVCRKRLCFWILIGLFSIGAAIQIVAMVRLHPYEYIYVNPLEGGVKGAFGHYELDYWGSSFKEAAERLQDYVNKEGGIPAGKIYKVAICGPWSSAIIYLPPDYEPVDANEPAEFFLSTTRWMCQNMRDGKEIIRIERMGAPLSIIKDLRSQ